MRTLGRLAISCVVIVVGCVLLGIAPESRGDEASAKARLAAKGIRATHAGLSLVNEADFSKAVTKAASLKRKSTASTRHENSAGAEEGADEVEALTQQNEVLRARLAEINKVGFAFRGDVVRQINEQIAANDRQIANIHDMQKQSTKSAEQHQQTEKSSREDYLQEVLEARKLGDLLIGEYGKLNRDTEVVAALKEWNEAAHTSNVLKPSKAFESNLKRLEILEKDILSEKVPLRKEEKTFYATVAIDGDKMLDMVVDSDAPNLVLPHQAAVDAGINVDAGGEATTVSLADGSKAQARHLNLKSVRVGSFTAKNVACDVLSERESTAKPVLGKSFLSQFKFDVDTHTPQLSLKRAGTDTATTRKKKPATKRPHKKATEPAPTDEPQQ